ncbi:MULTISPECIES: 16S rRNA (cytosine(967)-C(5))-methyltransferase RsmB [Bordetella]|uniref:16S rRNA (Cytosine(967)-C(5))-methyltransferase n=2 Tax=Bordetella TaxID=517 RepID=A0A261V605_9BORD|nr:MULTISPECIES: 16S rRNA (cytosine(967)-C(5))-methyltransferase RsmB [Bordetella]MDM9558838.1 16S rRNA (cytosine(967)-C(5))-methyltransferase RsmB [Bordetella petrii]OZI69578.1 16S rRNA (cytosine(967)-C(5))-methyltransferase [Bordetella genomosp. 2]
MSARSDSPDPPSPGPALAAVLLATAGAVRAVRDGRSLTDALAGVPPRLRPAVQAVSFHAMRYLGWADAIAASLVQRSPGAMFDALLRVALSLLKAPAADAPAPADPVPGMPVYAPHTVVNQAVTAAAGQRGLSAYKGLLNASLRRFLRERAALEAAVADRPEARWHHPGWWVRELEQAYPARWRDIVAAANLPAPLTLRVNRRRAGRDQVRDALRAAGIDATPTGPAGLVLAQARPVTQLPGFAEGWWSVQDAGAQLAAPLLGVRDGERVLDACAAPGGKTAHLLELADIDLLALDADAGRLQRVEQNLDRLGLRSERVALAAADAADPDAWWDGRPFDAVLADVPCTASGIVRRHPDIRWLRRAPDVARTAALQARIVDALWRTVAPGGRLLYVTCSIFPAEGADQAAGFLRRHPDARRLDAPGQLLPVAIDATPQDQHDGFFYALFAKQS